MALTIGTRLGPYEIVDTLGRGGMGEVYRARDPRLKRDVALKVLPAELATDPDRVARFQREAELVAGLTHPHIAALYGLEEAAADGASGTRLQGCLSKERATPLDYARGALSNVEGRRHEGTKAIIRDPFQGVGE